MIKEKDLQELMPTIRYSNGSAVTYQSIRERLKEKATQNGIEMAFRNDEVKYGGLIGGGTEPCLVLYHPKHEKDYFNLCIRIKRQGNYAFVRVEEFGKSVQLGNASSKEFVKDTMKNGDTGDKVAALLGAGVRKMIHGGANKQKLEEEQTWYVVVADIIKEIFS